MLQSGTDSYVAKPLAMALQSIRPHFVTPMLALCSKSSPAAVHMMEDALKWGAEHIFSRHRYHTEHVTDANSYMAHPPRPASASTPASSPGDIKTEAASPRSSHQTQEAATPAAAAAAEAAASPGGTPPASASPEPGMQSPFGAPEQQQQPQHRSKPKIKGSHKHGSPVFQPVYTDSVVDKLVQWSTSVPGMHARAQPSAEAVTDQAMHDADGQKAADEAVQSAGEVLGAGWECVKLQEWSQAQLDNDAHGDDGEQMCLVDVPTLQAACHCVAVFCLLPVRPKQGPSGCCDSRCSHHGQTFSC